MMKKSNKTLREILREQSDAELLWQLDEKEPALQAKICLEMGRRGLKDAVEALRIRLHSVDPRVREAAAEALGEVGDVSAAGEILKLMLDRDQPEGVRDTCAFALGKLKYAAALPELISALSDRSASVRLCVVAAFAAIQNPAVREHVQHALSIEADPAVKRAMIKLLDMLPRVPTPRRFPQGIAETTRNLGRGLGGRVTCTLPPLLPKPTEQQSSNLQPIPEALKKLAPSPYPASTSGFSTTVFNRLAA